MSRSRAIRCDIRGHVQGVYFRASTAEMAERLELDGWVRNLPDGGVEVVVSGDPNAVTELVYWLWRGPPAARVESVRLEEWTDAVTAGFVVQR